MYVYTNLLGGLVLCGKRWCLCTTVHLDKAAVVCCMIKKKKKKTEDKKKKIEDDDDYPHHYNTID